MTPAERERFLTKVMWMSGFMTVASLVCLIWAVTR